MSSPAKDTSGREEWASAKKEGRVTPPALTGESTVDDYVALTLSRNASLRAAHDEWLAAMRKIPQARSLPDPRFSYSYYIQEVETRVGPQRQRFSLSQMFPWFGKLRLSGDAAAKAAQTAWLDFQIQRLRLSYKTRSWFYEYVYLKTAIDITEENFDLLKSLEVVVRERYRSGGGSAALMQIQVELGKLEDRIASLKELRPALAAKLNAVLNRHSGAVIPWPKASDAEPPPVRREAMMRDLRRSNPDLLRLRTMADTAGISAALARKNEFPDITLGVSVIDTRDAISAVPDSGKDPVMATISVNLPIWRGKYRAQRQEALYRQSAFEARRDDKIESLSADTALALYHYDDAGRKLKLYRDTLIPKAKQSLRVARQAFQAGNAEFLNLIDAQRLLLDFQLEVAKARAEQRTRFAELLMLRGAGVNADSPIE